MTRLPTGLDAARGYRDNPFRVLGLPVDADSRAVSRRRREFELAGELGTAAPAPEHWLPLDGPPDAAAIARAYATWQDPGSRLVSVLLWLWHADGGEPPDEVDAIHDRAVTAHCEVLDVEVSLLGRPVADPAHRRRMDELWNRAAVGWAEALRDDRVWARLQDRVAEIDDPRLVPEDVSRLRSAVPAWFLSINASLAWNGVAARIEGAEHRAVMLRFARWVGVDADAVDESLRSVAAGTLRGVESACEAAMTAARAQSTEGYRQANALADRTAEPLAVLGRAMGADHPVVTMTRDRVAEVMRRCAVRQFNAAPDSRSGTMALGILTRALALADDATFRRIFDDQRVITRRFAPTYSTPVHAPQTETAGTVVLLLVVGVGVAFVVFMAVALLTGDQSGILSLLVSLVVFVVFEIWVLRRYRRFR